MRYLLPLVLIGCPGPGTPTDPAPEDLSVTLPAHGPYDVGYIEESITYDPGDGDRTLRLAVWFPTEETDGEEVQYQGFFPAPGVLGDVTPASGAFPLVVYSHGHQGYAEASGILVSHLVSHGYIVASPDHTGNTSFDGGDRDTSIFWHRPADIGATLDHMRSGSLALTDDPVVAIGHSFGGYTTHALAGASYDVETLIPACEDGSNDSDFCATMTPEQADIFAAGLRDERIDSIISMAPGNLDLFTADGLGSIETPVLHMTGGLDNPTLDDATWSGLDRTGNVRIHLSDGGHNIFADAAPGLDTGPEFIDPEEAWPAIGAYWLAWIRSRHGDETVAPVLSGDLVFGDTTDVTVGSE